MYSDDNYENPIGLSYNEGPCKRDYEAELKQAILRHKTVLDVCTSLDALIRHHGLPLRESARERMIMLYGDLTISHNRLQKHVEELSEKVETNN